MSILEIDVGDLRAQSVEFTSTELIVTLHDGRRIATPLNWYPRLVNASPAQRSNWEIMPLGIHWPEIDEDLSIASMLKGNRSSLSTQVFSNELDRMFDLIRKSPATKEQREQQRISFVFGNIALDNEYVTREIVDREAKILRASNG